MPYFDHNATHPVSATARRAWLEALDRLPANPSSLHRLGTRSATALEEAREQLSAWLGCTADQVIWTSGATESNNAVLHHLAHATHGEVWISAIEHPCVLASAQRWLPGRHRWIPVTPEGVVDELGLEQQFRSARPAAVAVMAANNETGILQPWDRIRQCCQDHGVAYFCDAAQWVGKLPSAGLGLCDYVTGCAHKFGGPPGVGFLKVPHSFKPLLLGGSQEEGRRAGTPNTAGILSMIAALSERESAMGTVTHRIHWRDAFERQLIDLLPGVQILGEGRQRLWNTITALMPPASDCRRRWVVKLDKLGCPVSTGSACASGKEQPSTVLTAMGHTPEDSDRMLRFSSGWESTASDWESLLAALETAAAELLG